MELANFVGGRYYVNGAGYAKGKVLDKGQMLAVQVYFDKCGWKTDADVNNGACKTTGTTKDCPEGMDARYCNKDMWFEVNRADCKTSDGSAQLQWISTGKSELDLAPASGNQKGHLSAYFTIIGFLVKAILLLVVWFTEFGEGKAAFAGAGMTLPEGWRWKIIKALTPELTAALIIPISGAYTYTDCVVHGGTFMTPEVAWSWWMACVILCFYLCCCGCFFAGWHKYKPEAHPGKKEKCVKLMLCTALIIVLMNLFIGTFNLVYSKTQVISHGGLSFTYLLAWYFEEGGAYEMTMADLFTNTRGDA